jgi:hypothetical protein
MMTIRKVDLEVLETAVEVKEEGANSTDCVSNPEEI